MKKHILIVVAAVASLGWTGNAIAAAITALPSNYSDGSAPLGSTTEFAPGWGSGSWQANGSSHTGIYFSPDALFGRNNVTIGELSSISYWTNSPDLHSIDPSDWFIAIYTKPYVGSAGGWYGNRINTEPYFSANINEQAGEWTQWSSNAGPNQLRFFDSTANSYFGSYTDGFLSAITGNLAYANQEILAIRVATATSWASGFNGYMDGLEITLTDNTVGSVNFEAVAAPVVPVPAAAPLGLLGMSLIAFFRRRKNAKA